MVQTDPFALTITRQLGSGAAYIGQKIAARLGALYLDREILEWAAQQLHVSPESLEPRDEALTPLWVSVVQSFACASPGIVYAPPPLSQPTDKEVFEAEAQVISQVARAQSAVVVGRGGIHALRDQPRHLSVFLHASEGFRLRRVEQVYHLSAEDARSAIEWRDSIRTRYHRMLTGRDWYDATQYDLCLDTGVVGIDASAELILSCLRRRFGVTGEA